MKKVWLSLGMASTLGWAATGNEHGNGGSVLVCPGTVATVSVRLFDYFEAESRGITISLGSSVLNYREKVELVLARLRRLNPSRAKLYAQWFLDFDSETDFTLDDLIQVPDVGAGHIPVGCTLKQAAAQRQVLYPGDKRYLVDLKLWELMSEDHKAGLVLHELIYREAAARGHQESAPTRYFNAVLSSSAPETMDRSQFYDLVVLTDLKSFDAQGDIRLAAGSAVFNELGTVTSGWVDEQQEGESPNPYGKKTKWSYRGTDLILTSQISFHANGAVHKIYVPSSDVAGPEDGAYRIPYTCSTSSGFVYVPTYTLYFDEAGVFAGAGLCRGVEVHGADGTVKMYRNKDPLESKIWGPITMGADGCPVLEGYSVYE